MACWLRFWHTFYVVFPKRFFFIPLMRSPPPELSPPLSLFLSPRKAPYEVIQAQGFLRYWGQNWLGLGNPEQNSPVPSNLGQWWTAYFSTGSFSTIQYLLDELSCLSFRRSFYAHWLTFIVNKHTDTWIYNLCDVSTSESRQFDDLLSYLNSKFNWCQFLMRIHSAITSCS